MTLIMMKKDLSLSEWMPMVVFLLWSICGGEILFDYSARKATKGECNHYKEDYMRDEYDFSKGKRGPVIPRDPNKARITIRLDADIIDYFKTQVHKAGGGSYQTLINNALREYMAKREQPLDENTLRRVIREELQAAH